MSTVLFNITLEYIIKDMTWDRVDRIVNKNYHVIADDVLLLARDRRGLTEMT